MEPQRIEFSPYENLLVPIHQRIGVESTRKPLRGEGEKSIKQYYLD